MDYFAPTDLQDALNVLAETDVTVLAGGTDFYPGLKASAPKTSLLDVTRIGALSGISQSDGRCRIGAATRWSDIVAADLPASFDGLKAAARTVGSVQIQNAGTIAGNICNASPAADGVPPLLTLEAEVELCSRGGTRVLTLEDFLRGVRQTARHADELVTAIYLPEPPAHTRSAFEKLGSRTYLVISISMVAVILGRDDQGLIDFARIAVGACSPVAMRLKALETEIIGRRPRDVVVTRAHLADLSPIDDVRGHAEFRLAAVSEQCARAIRCAGGVHG